MAQQALLKTPAAARKAKPRAAQLKLAGIATIQSEAGAEPSGDGEAKAPAPAVKAADTKAEAKAPKQTHPETKSA